MDEKTALVIGGSGGIGIEIVRTLAKKGIKVYATYHENKRGLAGLDNTGISTLEMDLSDEASVKNAFNQILKDNGRIDIVVLSASAAIRPKEILNMDWDDVREHLDVQTKGLWYVVQNLKGQLKERYKTRFIIMLTEMCLGKPPSRFAHYVVAKYSLMGLAKAMAVELASYNCTVNMVSPGMTQTGLISTLPPKLIELTAEKNPLKRIARPRDIANVVSFLSSDESDYLNGVNILVNGGEIML